VTFPGILDDYDGLEQRIREFPGIRFIAHGPDFWNHIGDTLHPRYIHQRGGYKRFGVIDRLLEEYPNLYCDISGQSGYNALKRAPEHSKIFLEKHASKVLYGTDNTRLPLLELLGSFRLGREKMDRILGKNALELLG
jgi:predicted TIM-barrel fold metal-dependent hydrolase